MAKGRASFQRIGLHSRHTNTRPRRDRTGDRRITRFIWRYVGSEDLWGIRWFYGDASQVVKNLTSDRFWQLPALRRTKVG